MESNSRQAVVAEMFHKSGTATDGAVSQMYELIELDPLHDGNSRQCGICKRQCSFELTHL